MTEYISKINANSTDYQIGGDNFDGQWIAEKYTIFEAVTLSGGSYNTYSLASYIPNDGYDYEVYFTGFARSGSSSGNIAQLVLLTGTATSGTSGWRLNRVQNRTAATCYAGGSARIPIYSNDRNITVYTQEASTNNTNCKLYAMFKRRIGKNFKGLYKWVIQKTIDGVVYSGVFYSEELRPKNSSLCLDENGQPASGADTGSYFMMGTNFNYSIRWTRYNIDVNVVASFKDDYVEKIKTNNVSRPVGGKFANGGVDYFMRHVSGTTSTEDNKIADNVSLAAGDYNMYSLANYIPNDGYNYEVLLSFYSSQSTSGKYSYLRAVGYTGSFNIDYPRWLTVGMRTARTNAAYRDSKAIWFPISSQYKYIVVYQSSDTGTTTYSIAVNGVRRIGTNNYNTSTGSYGNNIVKNINDYNIGGFNFDDQWIYSRVTLFETTFAKNSATTYSLSNYLPNDNYTYLVSFGGYSRTPSGSGQTNIRLCPKEVTYANGLLYGAAIMSTEYHSSSTYACSGNVTIPIFSDRKVTVINQAGNTTGTTGMYMIAYRRLGTNE